MKGLRRIKEVEWGVANLCRVRLKSQAYHEEAML